MKTKRCAKTRKAMNNTKTRKAMSYTKSTKAMKHIEKKNNSSEEHHRKHLHHHCCHHVTNHHCHCHHHHHPPCTSINHKPYPQKEKKNQLRSNMKTRKTMSLTKTKKVMAKYTTYLVCFCLLKLSQGIWLEL